MDRLLVMRHAKSAWDSDASSDFARPLSHRGRIDAPRMGLHIARQGWTPDAVVASPAARAASTALLAASAWGVGRDGIRFDQSIYGGSLEDVVAALEGLVEAETVMLVGHNPTMEDLVGWLADGPVSPGAGSKMMPTAAVAAFSLQGGRVGPRNGHLEWLARPADL